MYERLREVHPECTVSERTVRRYVHQHRRRAPQTGTRDLVWHPGEAQVDFGHADGIEHGDRVRLHDLVVSFPYSNAGYLPRFQGETAECVVNGLVDVFQHVGGVPHRFVFDNASGVGRRIGDIVHLTELFERCQAHYGFEVSFCNPYAGYEKGHVENTGGYLRRHLLVPEPEIRELQATNAALLTQSEAHWQRRHYPKGQSVATLFATGDRPAFRVLLPTAFAPYRYTRVRTDRQGRFCLEGVHWYSSAPEWAEQLVLVRLGAPTVEPLAADGRPVTTHARVYGAGPSESTDARTTVARLASHPGAWHNSAVREIAPEAVRQALDTAVRADVRAALEALAQCTERWGFDHALRALEEAVAVHRMTAADIVAVARWLALQPEEVRASGPNLQIYDALLLGRSS